MEETNRRIIRVDRRHCPHCQRLVSVKTFKVHKRLFYDEERKTWITCDNQSSDVESNCSSPPQSITQDDLAPMDPDIDSPPAPDYQLNSGT